MDHLMEKDSGMKLFPWTSTASADEWLGAESHMPNLKQELRKQSHQGWDLADIVLAGALFTAGLAMGSFAALWLTRSRRSA